MGRLLIPTVFFVVWCVQEYWCISIAHPAFPKHPLDERFSTQSEQLRERGEMYDPLGFQKLFCVLLIFLFASFLVVPFWVFMSFVCGLVLALLIAVQRALHGYGFLSCTQIETLQWRSWQQDARHKKTSCPRTFSRNIYDILWISTWTAKHANYYRHQRAKDQKQLQLIRTWEKNRSKCEDQKPQCMSVKVVGPATNPKRARSGIVNLLWSSRGTIRRTWSHTNMYLGEEKPWENGGKCVSFLWVLLEYIYIYGHLPNDLPESVLYGKTQ